MTHELLSVRLCELEDQLSRLSSRIHLSETAGHAQLQQEIRALRRECTETELALQTKLRGSRAEMVSVLSDAYEEIRQSVHKTETALQERSSRCGDPEAAAEGKLLLSEYALDFALQAANRALLLAMEAIDAQENGQEGDQMLS